MGPLVLFTINQSKLPQYLLPLMPAFALAAARVLNAHGVRSGSRAYVVSALAFAALLLSLPRWLPSVTPLTAAELAAIPQTVVIGAVVLDASAACVAAGLGALGYAVVVIAIALAGGPLLRAVGDDRSSAALAQAIAAVRHSDTRVMGVAAYPPSLPFYLRDTIAVATTDGHELTSNYVTTYYERYRAAPGSPLLAPDAWRLELERCLVPTIFVARTRDQAVRGQLAALPLVIDDGRYAAYGPCLKR